MDELKKCPFCGNNKIVGNEDWDGYIVYCKNCHARSAYHNLLSECEAEWNTRPIEDELQRKLDMAVEVLKDIPHEYIEIQVGTCHKRICNGCNAENALAKIEKMKNE